MDSGGVDCGRSGLWEEWIVGGVDCGRSGLWEEWIGNFILDYDGILINNILLDLSWRQYL